MRAEPLSPPVPLVAKARSTPSKVIPPKSITVFTRMSAAALI